jgi:C4-dicarboxylate-binding protein DctP
MSTSHHRTSTVAHRIRNVVVIGLALALFGCGKQAGDDKPILIKFPHVTAPATPKGEAADRFRRLVEERLAGRVTVEVYPSAQLMSDDDSLDALAFGEVQMIAISLSKLDRLTHKFQIFDLPFLFPDLAAVEKFQASQYGHSLLTSMVDSKLLGLTYWHNGMKQFSGPVPMRTPEAANGLKFRIMESDVLQAQILQIGGNPQKMAFGEVYQALQTGAVDAQENTWSNIYSSKFYEVQPYITETNHGYLGYLVAVNPDFWNSLPEDIRSELDAILREVTVWANEESSAIDLAGKQKIIESGQSEVIELTPEERTAWQQAMRPVWDSFSDSIGADLIEAAQNYDN